jgi:GNAT superfamily N-acetyltransferase
LPDWREAPIARHRDRRGFDCGDPDLNEYLVRYARRNHEAGGAKTFVAEDINDRHRVLGYYSIAPGALAFARVPTRLARRLGGYEVPIFRLCRLAVDRRMQGQGIGGELFLAAGERALAVAAEIGGVALAIDAKNDAAARWYARFGAVALLDDSRALILPLDTVAAAVVAAGHGSNQARHE